MIIFTVSIEHRRPAQEKILFGPAREYRLTFGWNLWVFI
jgi:hypothetical protein